MSTSGSPAEVAVSAVSRARQEVNKIRNIMARLEESNPQAAPPSALQAVRDRINQQDQALVQAEHMVEKTKERIRATTVGRQGEGMFAPELAKRAAEVIAGVPELEQGPGNAVTRRPRLDPRAWPRIPRERLQAAAAECTAKCGVKTEVMEGGDGLRLTVGDVFVCGLWFVEEGGGFRPESVAVCSVHEEELERLRTSKFVVFQVLTERATAAVLHFWEREDTTEVALIRFVAWLGLHRNLFRDKSEEDDRLLAFDSSRGAFLPPCVRAFEGDHAPRHPRSCIPAAPQDKARTAATQGSTSHGAV